MESRHRLRRSSRLYAAFHSKRQYICLNCFNYSNYYNYFNYFNCFNYSNYSN